jgi:hypothetical protein
MNALSITMAILLGTLGVSEAAHSETENTAQVWASQLLEQSEGSASAIQVTSTLRVQDGNPLITFRLVNLSGRTLKAYPFGLPWGNANSVSLLAIRADKSFVKIGYPIDDPVSQSKLEIAPGAILEGEYNLGWRLRLSELDRKNDIIVVWSYRYGFDGSPPVEATATGAVVIPRSR